MHGIVPYSQLAGSFPGGKLQIKEVKDSEILPELCKAVVSLATPALEAFIMQSIQPIIAAVEALFCPAKCCQTIFPLSSYSIMVRKRYNHQNYY